MTTKNELMTQIARDHLQIETLEERNRDRLDFHEVGVIGLRRALEAAYDAGRRAGRARRGGPRIRVTPLGECGRIASSEDDGHLLIVELDSGGTVHVPAADCHAIAPRPRR